MSGFPLMLNARDVDVVLAQAVEVEHPLPAFIQPYKQGVTLDVRLDVVRDTTLRRLLARGGPWWNGDTPTRAHLKLAMLAYTPTEPKFLAWLDRVAPVPKPSRLGDGSALPDGHVDGPRD